MKKIVLFILLGSPNLLTAAEWKNLSYFQYAYPVGKNLKIDLKGLLNLQDGDTASFSVPSWQSECTITEGHWLNYTIQSEDGFCMVGLKTNHYTGIRGLESAFFTIYPSKLEAGVKVPSSKGVHVINAYQCTDGKADIEIWTGGSVNLILTSYESCDWNVILKNGTTVKMVLIDFYDGSSDQHPKPKTPIGLEGVPTERIYLGWGSVRDPESEPQLREAIEFLTQQEILSLNTTYEVSSLTLE